MNQLSGKVAIITGTGSGIGLAVVQRYLDEGASVVAVVRRAESVENLPKSDRLKTVVGDTTDYQTNLRAVETALQSYGRLDAFVANAGCWDFYKKLNKMSADELSAAYDQILGVNLKSAFLAAHAAIEPLRETQGVFIVTGSNACFRPGGGGSLYTASKYALRGMVAQLALELAPDIRVNGVAPGATDTALSGSTALGQENKEMNGDTSRLNAMGEHIPMQRVSQPEEHTDLYVLLAGDNARYITGTILVSDGGLSAGQ